MTTENEMDIVARAAIMLLQESLVENYQTLQGMGKTNAVIEYDFCEFMKAFQEITKNTPPQQFSLSMVYKKLPDNTWGKIYQQIICYEKKQSTDNQPLDMGELKNNPLFQAYCTVARHGAH